MAETYVHTKWHLDPCSRLATIHGRKLEGVLCLREGGVGERGPHLTQCRLGRGLLSGILIYPAVWPQQTWGQNWGLCPFWGGGAGSPSNTLWPRPRLYLHAKFHLDPSSRLATIHQRHRQTYRQTDNGLIA